MSVAIVIPSHMMVHASFAMALATLVRASANTKLFLLNQKRGYVAEARIDGVRHALKLGADYVLFLDSDMFFPPTLLEQLLSAGKDVVGVNYVQSVTPHKSLGGWMAQTAHGVIEVDALPLGLMLIRTDVFRAIPEPWFQQTWNGVDFSCEDYFFCRLVLEYGFRIWMHTDLSLQVMHWGEVGFRWTGAGHEVVEAI